MWRSAAFLLAIGPLACAVPIVRAPDDRSDDHSDAQAEIDAVLLDDDAAPDADMPDARVSLEPIEGRYRGTCDGSAGVALGFTHFLGISEDDQLARVYLRGATMTPPQPTNFSDQLGIETGHRADFEDAARVGDRVYLLSSHGRKNDGTLDPARYRFAAIDLGGETSNPTTSFVGSSTRLLQDLLVAGNWVTPDTAVIDALAAASQLGTSTVANLAPKVAGVNMEGLALAPTDAAPARLVIGLRNPRPNGRAIVVSLLDPAAVVGGATARFGEAMTLDLGGLGIRGMAWSDALATVLLIAGPVDDATSPFRLYRWAGVPGAPVEMLRELPLPAGTKAEAIVTYPGTRDVQILLDSDDVPVGGTTCDDAPIADREFRDLIVPL